MFQLLVKSAFADFKVGDHITDQALVALYSATHPEYVVRKHLPEESASASTSAASPTVPLLTRISA